MAEEYYELANFVEVNDANEFVIARTKSLLSAVEKQRDYSVVQLLMRGVGNNPKFECIVVDVETDGVPPKNIYGINYRERLALCVPENPKQLIEVRALRKRFPILIHQNQGVPDDAASLCLYFEPPAAVLRTWTPQSFLRRIQWWLEKSAKAELHPADQPVEHLFFATKYELVLPWNFDELSRDANVRLVIIRGEMRPDQSFTSLVEAIPKGAQPKIRTLAQINLTLPPIVHGFVERDPATLGQLADLLAGRGVDIVAALQAEVRQRVGADGVTESADDTFAVIFLHIPVCRTAGDPPEGISHQAFIVPIGVMKLGVAIGALFHHDRKYFSAAGVLNAPVPTEWRSENIVRMTVLRRNDSAAARRQSGIAETGPVGILVGAGSLGSAMLNLWGRSGWGQWTVIDNDHVKPHNLARHAAYSQHIGETKVAVAAQLHDAVMQGASQITPIFGDAADLSNSSITAALSRAKLVVDASTTLEYPRFSSTTDSVPRHISVFITPNGNAAVLLAEDHKRLFRLRTLEAQYYRVLLQDDWGQRHLDGNPTTFWSGASCRDISMVMPYSTIMGHASTLAEQIPMVAARPDARICIWERDPEQGSVNVHDIPVHAERCLKLNELHLFIDDGAERQLRALRNASLPNETGGVLLGYYDFNFNAIVIVGGLSAPPDSKSSPESFERGVKGLTDAVADASKRTAGIVGYIGEWHSHPRGHSASPSRDDLIQLIHLAMGMADDGLPGVQLIVGEHDLQVLQGTMK
jgi:hypothetical protein